jgi:hypothetical protein
MSDSRGWFTMDDDRHTKPRSVAMLFINVEAVNARNSDLRRAADRDRLHRAPRTAHQGRAPQPRPPRARRSIRSSAVAAMSRVAR